MTTRSKPQSRPAEILREYGPFPDVAQIGGVTYDGELAWAAAGTHLIAFEPVTGKSVRQLPVASDAGTAFDGRHLYQLSGASIHKVHPTTGKIVSSIPAPGQGRDSGLTWAEGKLWVGQYLDRKIHCIDPKDGRILKTLESDRFVTGVTWSNGELWHATWENDESDIRHIDPETAAVLERVELPAGVGVSGLESNGAGVFFCGGGRSGKVRAVRKP
jgi:outer membrane protein assembly factor BamB